MPHRPARTSEQDTSISLFSGVFSFVSRELESFVANATGGAAEEDEDYISDEGESGEETDASSSRVLPRSLTQPSTSSLSQKSRNSNPRQKSKSKSRPVNSPSNGSTARSSTSLLTSKSNKTRRSPDSIPNDEEELSGSDVPPPAPISAPSPLYISRRRGIVSMPGSFYERSESLKPSPEPEHERVRVVRFASDVSSPPMSNSDMTPVNQRVFDVEEGPSNSRRDTPRPNRKDFKDYISSSPDFSQMKTPIRSQHAAKGNKAKLVYNLISDEEAQSDEHDVDEDTHTEDDTNFEGEADQMSPFPTVDKGKGKAMNPSEDSWTSQSSPSWRTPKRQSEFSRSDASFESRLRTIQQERDSLTVRHGEKYSKSQTNIDDEERARDKERIRVLEEELKKLKEELARRPVSNLPYFIPPPPPPPPPRNPASTPSNRSSLLSEVRASLKHTATPSEKPINPVYGGAPKRKGQPTVNVGADMMAAFLTELKTHRLRKVGNYSETSFTRPTSVSQPAIRAREVGDVGNRTEVMIRPREIEEIGNMSEILPRSIRDPMMSAPRQARVNSHSVMRPRDEVASTVGGKRKLVDYTDPLPTKRRNVPSSQSHENMNANEVVSSHIDGMRQSKSLLNNGRYHPAADSGSNSRMFSGSSRTETNITTPSLCSDNEQDNGGHEDGSPPTPPQVLSRTRTNIQRSSTSELKKPLRPPQHTIEEEDEGDRTISRHVLSEEISTGASPPKSQETDPFSRRPANSRLESPRRPQPPARLRGSNTSRVEPVHESLDMESTALDAWSHSFSENNADSSPLRLPIRPPPGIFKPPSRIPVRKSGPNKSSVISSQSFSRSFSLTSHANSESESLASEIQRAEEIFETDVFNDEVLQESGTFESTGTQGREKGYMAHGGAGGPPVLMGKGYVEGLEDYYDPEYEYEYEYEYEEA